MDPIGKRVAMVQESEAQPGSNPTQEDAMATATMAAQSQMNSQGSQNHPTGKKGASLGLNTGTVLFPPQEYEWDEQVLGRTGLLLQVGQAVLPGHQICHGVETVMSEDKHESPMYQEATQGPPIVSPLSATPLLDVCLPLFLGWRGINLTPTGHPMIDNNPLLLVSPKVLIQPIPSTSILCSLAQPQHTPLNTKALKAI